MPRVVFTNGRRNSPDQSVSSAQSVVCSSLGSQPQIAQMRAEPRACLAGQASALLCVSALIPFPFVLVLVLDSSPGAMLRRRFCLGMPFDVAPCGGLFAGVGRRSTGLRPRLQHSAPCGGFPATADRAFPPQPRAAVLHDFPAIVAPLLRIAKTQPCCSGCYYRILAANQAKPERPTSMSCTRR